MPRPLYKLLLFSALAGMFSACAAPNKPAGLIKPAYFNLEEVIDNQVKLLTAQRAGAEKTNLENGDPKEKKTVKQINWQRELEMFRQAAINRPAWRNEFSADSTVSDTGNKTITYRRVPGSDAPVEYLQVSFEGENLRSASAKLSTDNMLYSTSKVLEMQFANTSEGQKLRQYSVNGSQKMVLADALQYSLVATVLP